MADLQGGDWGVTAPFGGELSPHDETSPFPNPSVPRSDPFLTIAPPAHVSDELWQTSYYDPRSMSPVSGFVKRPSGPADLNTGKLTGEGFHHGERWQQV